MTGNRELDVTRGTTARQRMDETQKRIHERAAKSHTGGFAFTQRIEKLARPDSGYAGLMAALDREDAA